MVNLFWNLYQQRRISAADADVAIAKRKAVDASARLEDLELTVERLLLINQALWETIAKHQELTEEDLLEKVNEIDLRDGKLDGKLKRSAFRKCKQCGRSLHRRHSKCIFCGAPYAEDKAFG
ncbi:MAG: hypothetical protein A3K19_30470 [Lentisphaerae bacterium RIFOXYB12_FULL_65_16]|nr:MAG: hypothetical protein A3K18_18830 [Lentisphaerae bacterium RIFOXYA12_64_32]OGV85786.1 MAG: hypothetical protein A3K19_30470 [Lentisphaerae bacterium RIFOXYB12_FULL_65_16]